MTIIPERTNWLDTVHLSSGAHNASDNKWCALEAVAYITGEPHSDHPSCVDPVIAAFGRAWNDGLPDEDRDRLLKPFLLRMVGTASTPEIQDRRAFMAADWAVRVFTPAWLRLASLHDDATALEALPEMLSVELCQAAMPVIAKAQKSADAARAAARAAAWDAAGAAAWHAARAAAWDAAWDAARAAAWHAAGNALKQTVTDLQASASDLLDKMIRLTEQP